MQRHTLIATIFAGTMAATAMTQGALAAHELGDGRTRVEVYVQESYGTGGDGYFHYRTAKPKKQLIRNHRRDEPGVWYGEPHPRPKYKKRDRRRHDAYRPYRPGFRFVLPRLGRFRLARYYYGPYYGWYAPRFRFPPVPLPRIVRGLERRNYLVRRIVYKPARDVYVVKARDPYGARVRIVVDPYTTEILRYRPLG